MLRCDTAFTLPLRLYALLMFATCAAYANIGFGDFQFDDYNVIISNPQVHTWQAWWQSLGHGIRPLLKFSYTLNWTSSPDVAGFHLLNLLIHLGNVLLVFELSRRFMLQQTRLREYADRVACCTALVFALHPALSEAVTYVSGRSSALMTLFYLGGMLFYDTGRTRNDWLRLYLGVPMCFIAALAVKETAVTFPLALLLWERARGSTWNTALKLQWPYWLVVAGVTLFMLCNVNYRTHMETSAAVNSLQGNLATQASAITYLLRQWLFPLWLNIDPDLHAAHQLQFALPQLALLGVLCVLALFTLHRRPWLGFALAWVVLQLLPLHLLLPRLDVANDRQLYLLGWPLAQALVAELWLWLGRSRAFAVVLALLAITLGALTLTRNQVYRSEIALWEDTVVYSPAKARVHNNLGYAYMLAGRKNEARDEFTRALALDTDDYKARNNLARLRGAPAGLPE